MKENEKTQMNFIEADEIHHRMIEYLNQDVQLYSVGFPCIDQFYKVLLGNCTDITGYPYSGKTLWLMEVIYNLSDEYGFKHLLHLPDSGKPEEVIATLIQKRTGLTFDKRFDNLIDEDTIHREMSWINEHFRILQTVESNGKIVRPTPKQFWEFSCELDVQTACIDSWNYMNHESEGTKYLAETLSFRNELAERNSKHFFTIIHPKNPTGNDYDSDGKLKAPDVFSLMGGSEWNNGGKNIVVVHKDSKESFTYDVYFRKIKPRIVGKTGFECMNYDIRKQKFFKLHNDGRQQFAFNTIEKDSFEKLDSFGGLKNGIDQDAPF